jgi:hypothetical protein
MNASVDAGIYDTSARVRLAAVKLLTTLAPALASREVQRVALLKARDKDKEVRMAALLLLKRYEGCAELGVADNVRMLVLHGSAFADVRPLVVKSLWDFVVQHVADPSVALQKLRAVEHKDHFAPLLRDHIEELFEAQWPRAATGDRGDGEDAAGCVDEDATHGDAMQVDAVGGAESDALWAESMY